MPIILIYPINYDTNCVVYTGTHDNDTTLGWAEKLSVTMRKAYIFDYLGNPAISLHCALDTGSLGIGCQSGHYSHAGYSRIRYSKHRMNTPGTNGGNWNWRFQWYQLAPERAARLAHLVELFNRNQSN